MQKSPQCRDVVGKSQQTLFLGEAIKGAREFTLEGLKISF